MCCVPAKQSFAGKREEPRTLVRGAPLLIPGTPLAEEARRGKFTELTALELLKEFYGIIKGLELTRTVFRSDHASNHLPLEGVLPKDKIKLLNALESAISGDIKLKPEILRGIVALCCTNFLTAQRFASVPLKAE